MYRDVVPMPYQTAGARTYHSAPEGSPPLSRRHFRIFSLSLPIAYRYHQTDPRSHCCLVAVDRFGYPISHSYSGVAAAFRLEDERVFLHHLQAIASLGHTAMCEASRN